MLLELKIIVDSVKCECEQNYWKNEQKQQTKTKTMTKITVKKLLFNEFILLHHLIECVLIAHHTLITWINDIEIVWFVFSFPSRKSKWNIKGKQTISSHNAVYALFVFQLEMKMSIFINTSEETRINKNYNEPMQIRISHTIDLIQQWFSMNIHKYLQ